MWMVCLAEERCGRSPTRTTRPTLTPSLFQAKPLFQHKLTYEASSKSNIVRENAASIWL